MLFYCTSNPALTSPIRDHQTKRSRVQRWRRDPPPQPNAGHGPSISLDRGICEMRKMLKVVAISQLVVIGLTLVKLYKAGFCRRRRMFVPVRMNPAEMGRGARMRTRIRLKHRLRVVLVLSWVPKGLGFFLSCHKMVLKFMTCSSLRQIIDIVSSNLGSS